MAIRELKKTILENAQPEFCSVDVAEALSGLSRWTWRAKAYKGEIESVKVGTRLLLPLSEIRRVLAEGRRPRIDGMRAGEPSRKPSHCDQDVIATDTAVKTHA